MSFLQFSPHDLQKYQKYSSFCDQLGKFHPRLIFYTDVVRGVREKYLLCFAEVARGFKVGGTESYFNFLKRWIYSSPVMPVFVVLDVVSSPPLQKTFVEQEECDILHFHQNLDHQFDT